MIQYLLKQSGDGQWTICRVERAVTAGLTLGSAIAQARVAAKMEHAQSGTVTFVHMQNGDMTTRLALFGDMDSLTI